jgi:DNA (cytosine-5)-methyltransferase 1
MTRKILVADLLCGAGGSSTGCARALANLGLKMELVCVNHWGIALETHKKNHPEARHYCEDIAAVRPHIIVPEGYLDLLMASPTCTHHSVARGGKPTSDQQRSDPWHIVTWLTELRVKRMIIENVWEFTSWGPVDQRTGKPIKGRKGQYFHQWINTHSRTRLRAGMAQAERGGLRRRDDAPALHPDGAVDSRSISWPTPTHRKREAGNIELFPGMSDWRPARDIIDWNIKGRSIFNRKKPLAPKTLARIYAGAIKFKWPEPFLVILRNHMAGQSVDGPLPTIAANGTHIGLAQPIIVNLKGQSTATSAQDPLPTQTAHAGHLYSAEPIVLGTGEGAARGANSPLPTITTGGAGTEGRPGCARPMLVEPFVLSRHGEGAPRSIDEPTPTQVAKQSHVLISPYYGSGSGETCNSAENPLPTVTAKARFGMVVPVTNGSGGPGPRSADQPLPTMTTAKGGEFAIVMPVTHHDVSDRVRSPGEPLPTITGANRGDLAFITAQHGERPGQAPRVHAIDRPAPTIAASGHVDLIEGTAEYDILFRMLEPHELAAAMGFNSEEADYEFVGTKTEKIKQIGNAVSVAKMCACVSTLMADAAPKRKPAPVFAPEIIAGNQPHDVANVGAA